MSIGGSVPLVVDAPVGGRTYSGVVGEMYGGSYKYGDQNSVFCGLRGLKWQYVYVANLRKLSRGDSGIYGYHGRIVLILCRGR